MAKKKLDILVITNEIQTTGISSHRLYNDDIIMYGVDNLYPDKVFEITQNSPTAGGCVKRKSEFMFGQGIENGDVVVNRHGHTINDITKVCCVDMAKHDGFVLHFNYDLFGQITEIQHINIKYVRKMKGLESVIIGKMAKNSRVISFQENKIKLPLYKPNGIKKYIKEAKGFKKFNGAIYYFNNSGGIYPICSYEASLDSAQFENEVQVFSYMSAINGFTSSGIIKVPSIPDNDKEKKKYEEMLQKLVGSKNAGSFLIVEAPINIEGGVETGKMFEPFQTQDVDKLHKEQCTRAKDYILRDFNMPEILLGVSNSGMFNQESFRDAFDYYNGDTERERKTIERAMNKFWQETAFTSKLSEIKIIPMEMKSQTKTQKESEEE